MYNLFKLLLWISISDNNYGSIALFHFVTMLPFLVVVEVGCSYVWYLTWLCEGRTMKLRTKRPEWKSLMPLQLSRKSAMRFFLFPKVQSAGQSPDDTPVYLNVYDLTPMNGYIYWAGLGIFHSGIEGSSLCHLCLSFFFHLTYNQMLVCFLVFCCSCNFSLIFEKL